MAQAFLVAKLAEVSKSLRKLGEAGSQEVGQFFVPGGAGFRGGRRFGAAPSPDDIGSLVRGCVNNESYVDQEIGAEAKKSKADVLSQIL
jgi:hypothetical protein